MSESDFWMVYGMGSGAPTVRHADYPTAKREAERLARSNPGIDFYVMRPVSKSRRVDVETQMLGGMDDIPF